MSNKHTVSYTLDQHNTAVKHLEKVEGKLAAIGAIVVDDRLWPNPKLEQIGRVLNESE